MISGSRTEVLLASGNDYRTFQRALDNRNTDYTARAGHDLFYLDGDTTPYQIIIHEKFTGGVSTFIAENTEGMSRARPYASNT